MSPQNGNGSQGDSRGGRGSPPDLGDLFRQGKVRFGQMLPGGSTRSTLIIALLVLAGLGAWSAYYTVPSDSVAVVQRFGKYLK
jgi:membrane protease subunit HflK